MSNDAPDTIESQLDDSSQSHTPEGIPESLWGQILRARQGARSSQTTDSSSHPFPRVTDLPRNAPASLRLLAATVERIEQRGFTGGAVAQANNSVEQSDPLLEALTGTLSQEDHRQIATDVTQTNGPSDATGGQHLRSRVLNMPSSGVRSENMRFRTGVYPRVGDLETAVQELERERPFFQRESYSFGTTDPANTNTSAALPMLRPLASNLTVANAATSNESPSTTERSTSARRDLERALRDYRIARRALRSHLTSEPGSPADQNTPSYQGVMAQIAEQQSTNRSRMRARGQSRSNALERTDAIVDRIAAAAGVGNDAWRSDDDGDTVVGPTTTSTNLQNDRTDPPTIRGTRSTLSPVITTSSNPYLGPNTSARGNSTSTGGMRDFYQRVEDRQRNPVRSSLGAPRVYQPSVALVSDEAGTTYRLTAEEDREQRSRDALNQFTSSMAELQAKTGKSSYNASKMRAKKIIKYLSDLKKLNNKKDRGVAMAQELGIDIPADRVEKQHQVDLPFRICELDRPQFSSWLEAGVSWEGVQKGGVAKQDSGFFSLNSFGTGPLFEPGESIEHRVMRMRAWRHREMVRAERLERARIQNTQASAFRSEEERRSLLRSFASGMETLADVERHLSDLLEEEERHLSRTDNDEWRPNSAGFSARRQTAVTAVESEKREDHWPVKVTIHEVDWERMTVSGSMIASQILGQTRPPALESSSHDREINNRAGESSMETLFDGEIIDFENHELETVADKTGYKIGGLVTDLKYWSRIGPFKRELNKNMQTASDKKAKEMCDNLGIAGTLDQQKEEYARTFKDQHASAGELDRDEVGMIVYETMADCLGSRSWLNKAVGEDGWIFMRWKERCFISEPTTRPSSSSSTTLANEHTRVRNVVSRPSNTIIYATTYGDGRRHDHTPWSLTIRGFYYVALHRQTGKIEALYYDSGSHPYQELMCNPVQGVEKTGMEQQMQDVRSPDGGEQPSEDDEQLMTELAKVGIRREFGTYNFR